MNISVRCEYPTSIDKSVNNTLMAYYGNAKRVMCYDDVLVVFDRNDKIHEFKMCKVKSIRIDE